MTVQTTAAAAPEGGRAFAERRRLADRVFRGALLFNIGLTLFWVIVMATGRGAAFYETYEPSLAGIGGILAFVLFFYLGWGFVWYGIKALLLLR